MQGEAGAPLGTIAALEASAVTLGYALGNHQAEPQPCLLGTHEGLEQARLQLGGNAGTGIEPPQLALAVFNQSEQDVQTPPRRHGVESVEHEIDEQLVNLLVIGFDQKGRWGVGELQADFLLAGPRLDEGK